MHHQSSLPVMEQPVIDSANYSANQTVCRAAGEQEPPFVAEARRFFGNQELVARQVEIPPYDLPQLHQAMAACFPDWQLAVEGGPPDARMQPVWMPETTRTDDRLF